MPTAWAGPRQCCGTGPLISLMHKTANLYFLYQERFMKPRCQTMRPTMTRTDLFQRRCQTEPRPPAPRRRRTGSPGRCRKRMHALMGILVLLSSGIVWSTQLDEQPRAPFQAEPGDDATEPQIQQVYELMELETPGPLSMHVTRLTRPEGCAHIMIFRNRHMLITIPTDLHS